MLDGKEVSKAEAEAIASGKIASIDVTKSSADKKASIVRIVTIDTLNAGPTKVMFKRAAGSSDSATLAQLAALDKRAAEGDTAALTRLRIRGDSATRTGSAVFSMGNSPVASKTKFTGLLLVNNVPTPASELTNIAPDQIESVEVIKGPAAVKAFNDPLAVNGVIKITTKKKS
jgi:hypothetical protein